MYPLRGFCLWRFTSTPINPYLNPPLYPFFHPPHPMFTFAIYESKSFHLLKNKYTNDRWIAVTEFAHKSFENLKAAKRSLSVHAFADKLWSPPATRTFLQTPVSPPPPPPLPPPPSLNHFPFHLIYLGSSPSLRRTSRLSPKPPSSLLSLLFHPPPDASRDDGSDGEPDGASSPEAPRLQRETRHHASRHGGQQPLLLRGGWTKGSPTGPITWCFF